jgi:hypothetical protein
MGFFRLKSPTDMLEKARRERDRMVADVHVDHVYNFFVTAAHVADYVKHSGAVEQRHLDEFRQNPTYKLCRDLCDNGKHTILTKDGRETPNAGVFENSMFRAPFGTWNFGPQKENWMVLVDGRWVSVLQIANKILALWSAFFEQHGIVADPTEPLLE